MRNIDTDKLTSGAPLAPERADASSQAAERERLAKLAAAFESSLMLQMMREMRRTTAWDDESEERGMGDSESLFEMTQVEFATVAARGQSLGLGSQLLGAFDRAHEVSGEPRRTAMADGVTSSFGWRPDPFTGEAKFHRGIDIKAAYGEDVPVMAAGRVVSAGADGAYGTAVVVEHANGTKTRYAHLSVSLVRQGDVVEAGQVIGRAGSSGRATGPHLHFELLDRNGVPLDPTSKAIK